MAWPPIRLPVLDVSRFDAGLAELARCLANLGAAARDTGAFHLIGHGLTAAAAGRLTGLARQFFALPEQDKPAIEMVNSPRFRGYTRAGRERTRGQPDLRPAPEQWIADATALGIRLLRAIAVMLGQPEDVFAPICSPRPNILLKPIRYPGRDTTGSDRGVGRTRTAAP
jgi:isopenicillin N synthase-like dioxygenase